MEKQKNIAIQTKHPICALASFRKTSWLLLLPHFPKVEDGYIGVGVDLMGLFGRPAFPHCFGVSMAILANAQWSVNMPHQITALTGSCVVIPCRFSCPADHRPRDAVWYQYVNRGYPLVYSRNNPGKVIEKFRGKTELVGNVAEKNCSLKIEDVHATQNWEKLYVWIDPDETSF
ncbi:myelin-associated glycoprotein-like, partial [Arapaima gigas]